MARVNNLTAFLTDVAAAIKEKKGDNTDILAADFDTEIIGITTGHLDDEEYEEANNITDEILNGVDVMTIYPPDWSEIGYNDTPQFILDAFAYAKKIKQEWDPNNPERLSENDNLVILPLIDITKNTNWYGLFQYCSKLIVIPLLDTSKVTNMSSLFFNCKRLQTIPLLDTSNVTAMNNMFFNCLSLKTIPLLNTSNVNSVVSMFNGCSSLTTIPLLDISNVNNTASMFSDCKSLQSVPLLNTNKVTNMNSMFSSCSNLKTIPLLDTSNVNNTASMFNNCPSLSNESLNNILQMCINATKIASSDKTLKYLGLTQAQATTCQSLSNYQAFIDAGWITGY